MTEFYSHKQASKITYKARQRMKNQSAQEQLQEAKDSWDRYKEADEIPDADDSSISRNHLM